ncbi:MAG: ABC transporter ATP-binding protein [Pseudolabrys sp.]
MSTPILPASDDARYGNLAMVRRLLLEQGLVHWPRYAIAFVLMGIAAGCTALPAYLVSDFVNEAYVNRSFNTLMMLAFAMMAIFLVKGATTYAHMVILSRIGNNIIAENQRRLFAKLLTERLSFFADRHSSEFAARLSMGAAAANQVLNNLVTALGRDLLTLIGLIIVMFVQDPMMSLVTFVIFPPALLLFRNMFRRIRAIAKARFTGGTHILETLQETIQGIAVVKAFTLEDQLQRRFDGNVREVERESNKFARVANRSSPLMEALGGIAITMGLLYGGYRTIVLGSAPGEFISFITAFLLANQPARRLARLNIELNAALVNVRTLFDVLDSPATEPADGDKPALAVERAHIEFSDVVFAYRPGEPVLRNLSLVAEAGKVTALVGPSGGGKSTVFNLLMRFYEIDTGRITIDGQNIAAVSRRSLRNSIAYVGQHVFLFHGSIRHNIAFGKPDATDEEVVAAAKAACAHDFIMAFPHGYDTQVGEHGLQLSGGQRQRIAIARALIRSAPIILLDEATAALDSESEQQVQEALAHLTQERTTIVIAHRLHTVTHADCIHVIENGEVVESGEHYDLLRRDGRYTSFYRMQFKNQDLAEQVIAISAAG